MNPLFLILLLPILEIAAFIQVGDWIGVWPTIALILLSGLLGTALVRWQGLTVLKRAQEAAERGEIPVGAVFEGFCIVVAGVLLIIPGFLTDIVGLLLFLRPLRNAIGRWLFERLRGSGSLHVWTAGQGTAGRGADPRHRPAPDVIDGEYRDVTPEESGPDQGPRLSDSRWAPPDAKYRDDGR